MSRPIDPISSPEAYRVHLGQARRALEQVRSR
jgi:hypothetical protein